MQATSDSQLHGTSWRFVTIDGEAPFSEKATLEFRDDGIGATVGCNGMGGEWRVENGRLIAGPLIQTQMYCEGKVGEQEKAASALLVAAPTLDLEADRLILRSKAHSAELEKVESGAAQ